MSTTTSPAVRQVKRGRQDQPSDPIGKAKKVKDALDTGAELAGFFGEKSVEDTYKKWTDGPGQVLAWYDRYDRLNKLLDEETRASQNSKELRSLAVTAIAKTLGGGLQDVDQSAPLHGLPPGSLQASRYGTRCLGVSRGRAETLDGAYSAPREPHSRSVLYSMRLDPTTRDWQINRVTPADLPDFDALSPSQQRDLFE